MVRVVTREYDGPVYNMQVEEDESYTVGGAVVHNCMCSAFSVVTATPDEVVDGLRDMMRDADEVGLTPIQTPVDGDAFTRMLLDAAVFALLLDALAELGLKP